MNDDESRSVVARLGGASVSAMSIRAAAHRVVSESSWPARWDLLRGDRRLIDQLVARWFYEHGEVLLGMAIERACDAGLEAAIIEVSTAVKVQHISANVGGPTVDAVSVLREGLHLCDRGVTWLWPYLQAALDHVAYDGRGHQGPRVEEHGRAESWAEVRLITERVLLTRSGCSADDLRRVVNLVQADWALVWATLSADGAGVTRRTCDVARLLARWFDIDGLPVERIDDLQQLLEAVELRGPDAAAEEHRLILGARAVVVDHHARDLERANACHAMAVECRAYFRDSGATWVLPDAIVAARTAYSLTPRRHADRADHASNLGLLLTAAVQGGLVGLDAFAEGLTLQREAYRLTPRRHPRRASRASDIGVSLSLATQTGLAALETLLEAVEHQEEAYRLTAADDPNRATYASGLGTRLYLAVQANLLPSLKLVDAVSYQREAYQLTPARDPDRPGRASNLGIALQSAVQAGVADPLDLTEAVNYQRDAVRLTPEHHPARPGYVSNLSSRLSEAVQAGLLNTEALIEAVDLQREAYQLTPVEHPHRALFASNLGSRLGQAVRAGLLDVGLLLDAIECHREACQPTSLSSPQRPGRIANLGLALSAAVESGILPPETLLEAVACQREAYDLTPRGHPERAARASNLGTVLGAAFQARVLGSRVLDRAVKYAREAHDSTPSGHPGRGAYASNLATLLSLGVHAGVLGPEARVEAVTRQREGYQLTRAGHPDHAMNAFNLGLLLAEAVAAGLVDPVVLNEALDMQREGCDLTPLNHPSRAGRLSNFGKTLADIAQAGLLDARLRAIAAGEAAAIVDEFWRLGRRGATPTHRRRILTAARVAAERLPLMLLRDIGPEEAIRAVEALRGQLTGGMHAPVLPSGVVQHDEEATYRRSADAYETTQLLAQEGLATYADALPAATELADLVDRFRAKYPGLSSFGGRPQLAELTAGLTTQAVGIYLLPAPLTEGSTSDGHSRQQAPGAAVVIRSDGRVTHIPLPGLTVSAVVDSAEALLTSSSAAQRVCAWLWQTVAEPLLTEEGSGLREASEWVFVPSGQLGLLPLHAAGNTAVGWLDDHKTVRATPSLLDLSRPEQAPAPTGPPVAAISRATDLRFLPADLAVAHALIPGSTALSPPFTADGLLEALAEAPVAVLSAHAVHSLGDGGGLDFATPGSSELRWLTAQHIRQLPFRSRQWAVLSACSSGQVAIELPDEAIGLPAAFRHAGFRSVVATTWPISDHVAFISLARFLQHRNSSPEDSVAHTLRQVRRWLRTATRTTLAVWLDELSGTVDIPVDLSQVLRTWWQASPDLIPYAEPADWAPYACTGH